MAYILPADLFFIRKVTKAGTSQCICVQSETLNEADCIQRHRYTLGKHILDEILGSTSEALWFFIRTFTTLMNMVTLDPLEYF